MTLDVNLKILQIFSIRVLDEDTFPEEAGSFAVINCAESENEALEKCPSELLLTLTFDDTQDLTDPHAFSPALGKKTVEFLHALPKTVERLFVFCEAGESRSAAVAAAILCALGKSDAPVWENPFYHPNVLVYTQLCLSFGVSLTPTELADKIKRNRAVFHEAVTYGPDYTANHFPDRWEPIILE